MHWDEFERSIRDQRAEMDRTEPVPVDQLWSRIKPEIQSKKGASQHWRIGRNWKFLMVAASFLLIGSIGTWLFLPTQHSNQEIRIAQLFPDLAEQEEVYLHRIENRISGIDWEDINEDEFQGIFSELKKLEEIQETTWQDIQVEPRKEELVGILMRYYERKLMVLDRLQKELDRQKMQKQRDEEIEL